MSKKEGKQILSLDFDTMKYTPIKKSRFDTIRVGKSIKNLRKRLEAITFLDDKASKFLWECNTPILTYTAEMIPEIADSIIEIDNTMKWGFTREIGIFEAWDAIGVEKSVERMKIENRKIPEWVEEMLASGRKSFYETVDGKMTYWCPLKKEALEHKPNKKILNLNLYKNSKHTLKRDWSASLYDIGDNVLNVEFHSILQPRLNPIDSSYIEMINHALDLIDEGKYNALVLGHQGPNFSAGANLNLFLDLTYNQQWEALDFAVRTFQETTQRIRFSKYCFAVDNLRQ